MKEKNKTELTIWAQYFFIFIVTCLIASVIREKEIAQAAGTAVSGTADSNININEMLKAVWNEYFHYYFVVFLLLCAVRFCFVWLFQKSRKK